MVSIIRIGYNPFTNFTNILTRSPLNFQKAQRALVHLSSLLHGAGQEIKMPSLSPTMNEGKIIKWMKKEGDVLNPGDVLCDIETDKAVVSMEIEEEGVLAKILIPENTGQVKVGSLIALMVAEGDDWKNVDIPSSKASSESQDQDSSTGSRNRNQSNEINGPPAIPVKMPSLSPTMTEGTIVRWLAKEGKVVAPGDVLCEIQTDKALMSLETEEDGILAKILVPAESAQVKVGTIIALIVPEGEDWKNVQIPSKDAPIKDTIPKSQPSASFAQSSSDIKRKFGPAVKALLSSYQIESDLIKPSGRGNVILKEDVLNFISANKLEKKPQKPEPVPAPEPKGKPAEKQTMGKLARSIEPKYTDIQLTNMRQVIAKRLLQSKREIPHSYAVSKCNVTPLMEAKNALAKEGTRVSMNDLITKSTAMALNIYPKANALYVDNQVKKPEDIDVCVAVATKSGLFTPIVKSTNSKSIATISREIRELSEKAKTGKLKPDEYAGGTFTISNLGMFGVSHFKAIINPPQCGILAVGTISTSFDADLKIQNEMTFSLSYDRRAMDEVEAAEFMSTLKYVIENPKIILMGNRSNSSNGL